MRKTDKDLLDNALHLHVVRHYQKEYPIFTGQKEDCESFMDEYNLSPIEYIVEPIIKTEATLWWS